jgi:hypothetical protein
MPCGSCGNRAAISKSLWDSIGIPQTRQLAQGLTPRFLFLISLVPHILSVLQEHGGIMKYVDNSGAGLFSKWRLWR